MKEIRVLMVAILPFLWTSSSPAQNVPAQLAPEVFKVEVYEGIYPDVQNTFGANTANATNEWQNQGLPSLGQRASFIFDPVYYLAHNPDVAKAYGANNYLAAAQDFMSPGSGLSVGRRGSLEFDVQWYLNHYPDLKAAYGTNYLAAADHFLGTGLPAEGRQGSPDFSVKSYTNMYPDVSAAYSSRSTFYTDATLHWLRRGKAQGRHGFGFFPVNSECATGQTMEFGTVPALGTPPTITVSRPSAFISDAGVVYVNPADPTRASLQPTTVSPPAKGTYLVSAGVYTFSSADAEQPLQITYNLNPVPPGYTRIFFADPAVYKGAFGNGSTPTNPLFPGQVAYPSHTVALALDYQLRCRAEGGPD